jgi:hypothetical protein
MPRTLMVSPYVKTVFSTFMADSNVANQRYETPQKGQTTIVAAADMYLSDFGPISVVPNRQMARAGATVARNAFLIDPRMVSLGVFDDIQLEKPAKTGDAEKRVLVTEYTLLVNNEAAHGVAADLFGLTSSDLRRKPNMPYPSTQPITITASATLNRKRMRATSST